MSEQQLTKAALAEAMAPWFDQWVPCELGHQDRTTTTQELMAMVHRFHPLLYEADMLVQLLRDRGFKHALIGDEFRWLLMAAEA